MPLFPKLCGIPSTHAYEIYFKIVTLVIEKMKLASFSLFLGAFPPRPKMPFGQLNVAIQIYTICKGRLGSRGERNGISERRQQISDKNRPLCSDVRFYCTSTV